MDQITFLPSKDGAPGTALSCVGEAVPWVACMIDAEAGE
jgi:hypothetical protein